MYTLNNSQEDAKKNTPKQKFNKDIEVCINPVDQGVFNTLMKTLNKYKKLKLTIISPARLNISITSKTTYLDLFNVGIISFLTKNAINVKYLVLPSGENKIFCQYNLTNFTSLETLIAVNTIPCIPVIHTLKHLDISGSTIQKLCTQPSLTNLYMQNTLISELCNQPNLTELNMSYTDLPVLPTLGKLKILICHGSTLRNIPSIPLDYIFAIDTQINFIPTITCASLQHLFTECEVKFASKPKKIVEYYIEESGIYYVDFKAEPKCMKSGYKYAIDMLMMYEC